MASSNHDNRQLAQRYFQTVFSHTYTTQSVGFTFLGSKYEHARRSPGGYTGQVTAASALLSDRSALTVIEAHLSSFCNLAPTQPVHASKHYHDAGCHDNTHYHMQWFQYLT